MKNILLICAGNVVRSQMAESFYNYFTQTNTARSAGVLDFTPAKYGHPVLEVISVMNEEGLDVAKNIVKTVTKKMVLDADHVYILCKKEECPDFLLSDKQKITFWEIDDPFGSSLQTYRIVRDQIKNLIQSILQ
jgi:arsenate reductase (thioredoxin)